MSTVLRDDNLVRPSWEYADRDTPGATRLDILEMLESIRNTLEEIRDRLPKKETKCVKESLC